MSIQHDTKAIEITATKASHRTLLVAYTGTMLLSATLLFLIQPIFARMALPLLGGTPAVWAIAMCFFQAMLLGGYAYAHVLNRYLQLPQAVMLHVALLIMATQTLPITAPAVTQTETGAGAGIWLAWIFAKSVGFPFFVLSATAPLLQSWFANTTHKDAANPYFLYGASNIGSIGALLLYPAIIEHSIGLRAQSWVWAAGYATLLFAIAACGLLLLFWQNQRTSRFNNLKSEDVVTSSQRLQWVVLSFLPSALLVAWTNHITTDLASAPFLWLPPLILFLLTFIVTFRTQLLIPRLWLEIGQVVGILGVFYGRSLHMIFLSLALGAIAFFCTACLCHRRIYEQRPGASKLTEFYMWMSVGGVLGGLFVSLIAPVLFNSVVEYPVLMLLGLLIRDDLMAHPRIKPYFPKDNLLTIMLVLAFEYFALIGLLPQGRVSVFLPWIVLSGVVIALAVTKRHQWIALPVMLMVLTSFVTNQKSLHEVRSYFGVMRVEKDTTQNLHILSHGTTIHGAQYNGGPNELKPLTYYGPDGGMALALKAVQGTNIERPDIAIVGLGTGSLACYAKPNETWAFYEIDPHVISVANDSRYFTFLNKCTPDANMIEGDARLKLAQETGNKHDYLLIDAFSSDSIPIHLLTTEAFQLYLSRLSDNGTLVLHLSNRYMDLISVVEATMRKTDPSLAGIFVEHHTASEDKFISRSQVVVFTRNPQVRGKLLSTPYAKPLDQALNVAGWTDDFANIPGAIWRKYLKTK